MAGLYTAETSVVVDADNEAVWSALADPELVKKYFFGTQLVTSWEVGSPIVFKGEWEGKTYEDKGKVLEYDKPKKLRYSYWSSMSGKPDSPENYGVVSYTLDVENGQTKLTVSQDNVDTEESRDHSIKNWQGTLQGLKKMVEEN